MVDTYQRVFVTRGDLASDNRQRPLVSTYIKPFPRTREERNDARNLLRKLFETKEATPAILLFVEQRDADRRAKNSADSRVLAVNLVGQVYRELRAYVQDVGYAGALPRIDGNAFLVFGNLAHSPKTNEELIAEKLAHRGRGDRGK